MERCDKYWGSIGKTLALHRCLTPRRSGFGQAAILQHFVRLEGDAEQFPKRARYLPKHSHESRCHAYRQYPTMELPDVANELMTEASSLPRR